MKSHDIFFIVDDSYQFSRPCSRDLLWHECLDLLDPRAPPGPDEALAAGVAAAVPGQVDVGGVGSEKS